MTTSCHRTEGQAGIQEAPVGELITEELDLIVGGLLLPAVQQAREAARPRHSKSQLMISSRTILQG